MPSGRPSVRPYGMIVDIIVVRVASSLGLSVSRADQCEDSSAAVLRSLNDYSGGRTYRICVTSGQRIGRSLTGRSADRRNILGTSVQFWRAACKRCSARCFTIAVLYRTYSMTIVLLLVAALGHASLAISMARSLNPDIVLRDRWQK